MDRPEVSIIIPHYQTEMLARLSLRSIRRYTTRTPYEVIVVDNGSADGRSLEYLRGVKWIRLIERTEGISEIPGDAHKEALDAGIAASDAPYILSFHTDTVPIREGWLAWLVEQMNLRGRIAAVGTYKLERTKPLKRLEHWLKSLVHRGDIPPEKRPYIRSHCALYRRSVMDELGLKFADETTATGQGVHLALEAAGYEAVLLSVPEMLKHVVHLNHGTMVLIPELGARSRTIRKGHGRIDRFMSRSDVRKILNDETLDS